MDDKDKRGSRETNAGVRLLEEATGARCSWLGVGSIQASLHLLQKHVTQSMSPDKKAELLEGRDDALFTALSPGP